MIDAARGADIDRSKRSGGARRRAACFLPPARRAMGVEKGFFRKYGLDVTRSRAASWANIRDKVSIGALDGAHMLAGMPIAVSLGLGTTPKPMRTAFSMDLNGNAITVSNDLYARMVEADPEAMRERPLTARALKKVIDAARNMGRPPITFASVFPV
jgi:nitrate/nitrite transport system substrate-binding protein